MSDEIHEECGIATIRLKKTLSHFKEKYNNPLWALEKLFLLLEKQQNRGQDGTGVGCCKLNIQPGKPYLFRERNIKSNSLSRLFSNLFKQYDALSEFEKQDVNILKDKFDFAGEVYVGHLRYGTSGEYNISSCHPYFRKNNWPTKNLMLVGNFNITNTSELNKRLINFGQHPIFGTDTQTLLEEIGFYLDQQHNKFIKEALDSNLTSSQIFEYTNKNLDIPHILRRSSRYWDGGYALSGVLGSGDVFGFRDAHGIRPMFYYESDEVIAIASERAPLMTVFNCNKEEITEVTPGSAIIIRKDGSFEKHQIIPEQKSQRCSFERIYFSRGNDPEIYQERKKMGKQLISKIKTACEENFTETVFSFIPNTAEVAYYGLIEGIQKYHRQEIKKELLKSTTPLTQDRIDSLFLKHTTKIEKVAIKDSKLRTFINREENRSQMASHVYDISYNSVKANENLVVLDDSIVRGTTLKKSIIHILSRLNPKKIIIASTAPQIRYPDCYGIDMSNLSEFIAFQAVLKLLERSNQMQILEDTFKTCMNEIEKSVCTTNPIQAIYDVFTDEQISKVISELASPENIEWKGKVEVIFQSVSDLHKCLTNTCGDWYFTGNYPTSGGYRVVCKSFINFYNNDSLGRSY